MTSTKHVNTVSLSDRAPNVVILQPITLDKSRSFAIAAALRPPPTRDKARNFAIAAAVRPPTRDDQSVDLISVTSDDYQEDDNLDQISFDEGRLQEWNSAEFQMQLLGAVAGMVLLFGCGLMSAWAITDFIKDFQQNEVEWLDIDYSFELLDKKQDDFLASHHVIIAMVVLSYNVGCIVGAILGAFIVPLLRNRLIFILGSVLMLFTGMTLTSHTSAFYCARSRLMAGLVCGLMQLTVIVQAAESTTKKVRRWMLIVVAYVNAVSSVISTLIFYYYDGRDQITYTEDNTALYIISYLMGGCAIAALILNFLFTRDTIPFHLVRGEETLAFKEMSRLKADHLSMLDIRYEYDRIRFEVTQSQIDTNRNLAARQNHVPLISMCCVRILNLVFTSVPITLVLIWNSSDEIHDDYDDNDVEPMRRQDASQDDDLALNDPLLTLAIYQGFRMFCSVAVMIRQDKYHFNRTCYKLAGIVGATLIFWSMIHFIFNFQVLKNILIYPVLAVIVTGFIGLPIPLDTIQLNQSADSYARIKNTWSLAFAIFIENIVHIFLIIQLDMIFGFLFVSLMNGLTLYFFSYWLLRNMPNVVSIHPFAIAIVAQAMRSPHDGNTIHI